MELYFNRPALIPPADESGQWELLNEWHLVYRGFDYVIPAGFQTDGASIPRFFWRIWGTPLSAPRLYAAIVHDYLYTGSDPECDRAEADALYRDIQIELGISKAKAYAEYYSLRLFGGSHWKATC